MRVVIAAAHANVRASLRAMVAAAGLNDAGEAPTAAAAARLLAEADVLLVDDAALLHELLEQQDVEDAAIVVLADSRRMAALLERAGLRGWALLPPPRGAMPLHDGEHELAAAVHAAHAGFSVMPAAWTARAPEATPVSLLADEGLDERLTMREQEVLELLGLGLSNRRIAERLGISEHTVKFHVNAIYGKLDASSRTEAVNHALRRGLLRI